jgi:hypothetical protein
VLRGKIDKLCSSKSKTFIAGAFMAGFKTPVGDRYFEDYVTGSVHEFGRITIYRE